MPSLAASLGPAIFTGLPSKKICPSSIGWMPATDLISVDLPAPLSPTSAITSPLRTSKSTSLSAWTEPNRFVTPRSSRIGVGVALTGRFVPRWGRSDERPHRQALLLAVLLVLAAADLALLQGSIREEELVVLLRDPDGLQQDRLRAADLGVDALDGLPLDQRDRYRCGRIRFLADRLVDGPGLPAGEDELDARRGRVLSGQRDRLEAVRLQRRDHGTGKTVVRGDGRVDLVAVASEHLVEDLPTLRGAPLGVLVTRRALLEGAVLEQRVQDLVIALLEEDGVVVLDVTVQLDDNRVLGVFAVCLQSGDEALALQVADGHAVVRDVVGRFAADHQAVVVDHLCTARDGQIGNRLAGRRIQLVEQDHLGALRKALLRL